MVDGEPVVRVVFGHFGARCVFLMVWLAGWSLGCFKIVSELSSGRLEPGKALFALPFFAAEIVVSCVVLLMIFGKTVMTFRRRGCTKFFGVGRFGRTKEFPFPEKGEICTDEVVRRGSKGGSYTVYRLLVKTHPESDAPLVVYDSIESGIINVLCEAAKEVAVLDVAPAAAPMTSRPAEHFADDAAPENQDAEQRDYELLAGKPPKGMSVARDLEGRVVISLRRVSLRPLVVIVVLLALLAGFIWHVIPDLPIPLMVIIGVAALFPPSVQLVFSLFGRRVVTLDHGSGTTFAGIGPVGFRRRFSYVSYSDVRVVGSGVLVNGRQMDQLVVAGPDGTPQKICMTWPNDVKPYLAAILRHPGSAPASVGAPAL